MTPPNNGRKRLLVLTSTFPRWPGDSCPPFVADLSEGLARGFDVTVLAPGSQGALPVEQRGGVTVRRYRYSWPDSSQRLADGAILPNLRRNKLLFGQVPLLVLAQLWAAWRLTRDGAFDAIHAHWAVPQGWVAAILRSRLGLPVLTTTHGGDIYALKKGPALRAKRWAMRSSDRITAVSNSLKREVLLLGIDDERVRVLPMGVDVTKFTPEAASRKLPHDGPLLLFVGRLVEKKGVRYAIEAMPAIVRVQPGARLLIVGDGPEREPLETLRAQLGLATSVEFVGAVPHDELPRMFASADLFVGPSVVEANGDTESFGVVFAEAMACGCPVIATDVGGISDLVVDGETGVLVPQRDASAIADAATAILGDAARRERLSSNGPTWVRDRFALSKITEGYAELIEEIAA